MFRISNCTVENQIKFATCTLLRSALTWWNSHIRIVGHDVAYAITWKNLKNMMTDKYCPRGEIKKIEVEMWNLKVKGTDVISYNQHFQELALICFRMFPEESDKIEKYVSGLLDMIHGNEIKRKLVITTKLNNNIPRGKVLYGLYQWPGERKEYAGTLSLCNKCKFHHNGQCTIKCANCKRIGHLTQDCRRLAATNNQRNPTGYECRNQGHYRSDCLELKN
ncbi:reverse transcriptase domain-containing protein [Tanacetum coccineum]